MDSRYKRMLDGMMRTRKKYHREEWFVYILRCQDETLYTGVTKDLERRLKMHNGGKASKYTRTRRPVLLIYSEKAKGRAKALVREFAIKAMSKAAKESLISGKEIPCRVYSRKSSKVKSRAKKLPKMKTI